jgi:very-short-patch-repair endonuclease
VGQAAHTRHRGGTGRDEARTVELARLGYRVFRVRNIDVHENLDRVLDALLGFIEGEHR